MTYPLYDESVLPCISLPVTNSKKLPERYLGRKAVVSDVYTTIKTHASTDLELHALHLFWEINCNYGLEPFIINTPMFGQNINGNSDFFIAKFTNDVKDTKNNSVWSSSITLKIIGEVNAIVDDAGNLITSDADDLVVTDAQINILYGGGEISSYRYVKYGIDNPTSYTGKAIPIYDPISLPCISTPFSDTQVATSRYLGRKAFSNDVYADLKMTTDSNDEAYALELFWREECNYGLEPFIIHLPVFGIDTNIDLLVMFRGEIKDIKNEFIWNSSRSLKILGKIVYVVDGNGDFTLSQEGDFVLDEDSNYVALPSKIYKELTYAVS